MSWYIASWIRFIHKYADFTLIVPPVMHKLAPNVTNRWKRIIVVEVMAFLGVAAYLLINIMIAAQGDNSSPLNDISIVASMVSAV